MKKFYLIALVVMAALAAMTLASCSKTSETEEELVDTTVLEEALAECQALLDDADGNYPPSAIAAFQQVCDTVREALEAGGITAAVLNNLLNQLEEAKATFLASKYEDIPDVNLLLSYEFETEDTDQTSTGSLAYVATLTAGPSELFSSGTSLPTFVDGVGGGKAISFENGSHLVISEGDYSSILKNEFAISVWVKPTAMVAGNYVFSMNTWNTCKLNIQNEGKPFFTPNIDGSAIDADNEMAGSVPVDTWTHVVVTLSLTTDEMSFYINGELTKTWGSDGKPGLSGSAWTLPDEFVPIMIGTSEAYDATSHTEVTADSWVEEKSFNGAIDNLRIYDLALTSGQVAKLYAIELAGE